jgi:PKHD-type hydroxylase
MLTELQVLSTSQAATLSDRILARDWRSGLETAGHQSARAKRNLQLAADDPEALSIGESLVAGLGRLPDFAAAALPRRIFPPVFARYRPGDGFGRHVDNAIRYGHGGSLRTDLSATLFLSPPDSYDGGALLIDDTFGPRRIRLPAGHMVLYPSSSLHSVEPITRGERLAVILWMQSLVRDDGQRALLLDLDRTIQSLASDLPEDPRLVALTGTYHNLVRRWAEL